MLEKRGLPILHWAIAPWYPVEKTGCACIMSFISFQATHLEPGTGTCELQQQLVHLIATAQTHGEFRNERKRCSSLSEEEKKKKGVRPHFYRVHRHVGLAADLFHCIVYFAEDCLIPVCAHQSFAVFKSQARKMSTVYIRGGQAVA